MSAPTVAANHTDDGSGVDGYVAQQGGTCVDLAVLGDGTGTVESFYDYRWEKPGEQFSSYGTTHLQQTDVSQLFLHHGSEGVSLVMIHDELNESGGDAGNGGGITFEFEGLPDGEFAVMDDDYDEEEVGHGPDDRLQHDGATAQADWVWASGRTDGAAYRGIEHLGDGESIAIDPAFGPESWAGQQGFNRAQHTDDWRVRHGVGDDELHSVAEDQRLTIERGTCGVDATLEASLVATPDTAGVGEHVTLEATTSGDAGPAQEYRWDFDGDGDVDRTTNEPTVTTTYDDAGTVTPEVTVVADGDEDAASATVEVVEERGPDAAVSAPGTAELGEPATLDASGSSAEAGIETYRWDVGDDGDVDAETSEPTYEFTPSATGERAATVTVVDANGGEDVASTSFEVVDTEPPVAAIEAPDTTTVGEQFTVDGSASSDEDGVASYEWTFGDGETASGATATHTYDEAGSYDVTLTVTDPSGNENQTTTTVDVESEGSDDEDDGDGTDGSDEGDGDGSDEEDSDDGDENDGDENDGDDADENDGDAGDGDSDDETDSGDETNSGDAGDADDGDGSDGADDADDGDAGDGADDADGSDGEQSAADDSNTGSSGGLGGSTTSRDTAEATLEAADEGALELTVENSDEGESVRATASDVDAPIEAIEVELAEDVDEWSTTLEPTEDAGDGLLYRLDPDDHGPFESVTYEFGVPLESLDGDHEDLDVAERDGDDWTALDAETQPSGPTVFVTAESDVLRPVALGTGDVAAAAAGDANEDDALEVTAVDVADGLDAGDPVAVTATVRNDGATETTESIPIAVGEDVVEETVTVPAGETATVEVEHTVGEPGTYDVGAGDEEQTVTVGGEEDRDRVLPVGGATFAVFAIVVLAALTLVAIGRYAGQTAAHQ